MDDGTGVDGAAESHLEGTKRMKLVICVRIDESDGQGSGTNTASSKANAFCIRTSRSLLLWLVTAFSAHDLNIRLFSVSMFFCFFLSKLSSWQYFRLLDASFLYT